ncbi:hypothetical protein RB25_08470 [Herbaspirillum rubrisubalbicans]|uniref:DUF2147 domain-containing protein n=5 Tax=Herbaspirillum TaxID=963 RepID=A0ABX9C4D9_9BURK|nr:hypothetical protein [Herbaspirillum rubrisubalbicans]QJP99709.1 DUF2147 domain-containing protein [Herbaspirillum rubrisubalbicans Os34]RAM65155.1 hypothetical protein RB24_07565 [Herbaspirillum rubrisubalbicans]RAN48787.1 hypothetical protein RB25_08470 [Herbaspirillum rubrisubalbicans]
MMTMMKTTACRRSLMLLLAALSCTSGVLAHADEPADAKGLWATGSGDAVIKVDDCPDKTGALCAQIVWDKDAGQPTDTCNVRIAQLDHFEHGAWRDGWAYDPRSKKNYKATLRVKDGMLNIRAFVGVEMLGETESFTRVERIPPSPVCKPG